VYDFQLRLPAAKVVEEKSRKNNIEIE